MDLTQLIAAAWREERERYTLYAYTDGSWVLDQHGPEDIALALIEGTREACQAHLDLLCARAAEKALEEQQKGKRVVLVYPVDKWVLMLLKAICGNNGNIRNLGDVKWLATEDGSEGKGTGRHIACFILEPSVEYDL